MRHSADGTRHMRGGDHTSLSIPAIWAFSNLWVLGRVSSEARRWV